MFRWLRRHRHSIVRDYKPVILVTGCSSGIGLELAKLLYKHQEYRVVVTARERSLEKIYDKFFQNDRFIMRSLDVTNEDQRRKLFREVESMWGGVDVLVNNAGISYRAVIEHMTEDDEVQQMSTNYFGPVGMIRLALPHMRRTGRGKIINVSSVAGMLAMPTMSSYSASKMALEGASEALWYEMRPFGVSVTNVQPGFIHSNSFMNVYHTKMSDPARTWNGPYTDFYQRMGPFIARMMDRSFTTAEDIAHIIFKVIKTENPPLRISATLDARVFNLLRRFLPRQFFLHFLYWCLPRAYQWSQKYSHKRS
jgi:short-subunit dehydrogenase